MLSVLPREALENIFDRLPPERLDMLKQMCKLMHLVSAPLILDFRLKWQRQKVRTLFFDLYDRLKTELNGYPIRPWVKPVYLYELRANRAGDYEPWVRAYVNSKKLSMGLLDNAINIIVIDLKTGDNTIPSMWLHHNRLMVRRTEYPFPEDPYVFVRNALDGAYSIPSKQSVVNSAGQ